MIKPRPVVVFAFAHPWLREIVRQSAPQDFDVRFVDPQNPDEVRRLLPLADFLVTAHLPAEWVPLLERCRLVQHQGVGYDGIAVEALARARIPLALTPEGTVIGVAEHTLLLILALYRQLIPVHKSIQHGEFDPVRWRANAHLLYGKQLGLVGFGRIGRRVASLVRAFEAEVAYYDIVRAPEHVEQELGVVYLPFESLLARSDIVSVHLPLTSQTRGLFNREVFQRMKRGALFINTSRGGIYDMDALYEALRSGHLGGAGLDVFEPEPPPPDHPLLQLPNVVCTPHMAAGTVEGHLMKIQAQFENFRRVLRGEPPNHLVQIKDHPSGEGEAQ